MLLNLICNSRSNIFIETIEGYTFMEICPAWPDLARGGFGLGLLWAGFGSLGAGFDVIWVWFRLALVWFGSAVLWGEFAMG